jgi:hypothetical protein
MIRYEIRKGDNTPCQLVSIVPTKWGGEAVNFVCAGTHTFCASVKAKLEGMAA